MQATQFAPYSVNSAQFMQNHVPNSQSYSQPGQQALPKAQSVSQIFVRSLFDRIKKGNVADIMNTIRDNCIDISQLKDEQNFN
jgi:hypothetical protein